jgi:hypothetical protein
MDIGEIRWEVVDWMHLAQDRGRWRALVNTVMKLRISQKEGHFARWATVIFSKRTLF